MCCSIWNIDSGRSDKYPEFWNDIVSSLLCYFSEAPAADGAAAAAGVAADESGDSESEDEDLPTIVAKVNNKEAPEATAAIETTKESKAAEEISALINYVQAVRFHGFELSESKKSRLCLIIFPT